MKRVFVINGKAGVGKDKFIKYVSKYSRVVNYSSVQVLKDIATEYFGYNDDIKTDKDRKFLADLKALTTEYCDFCFENTIKEYDRFVKSADDIMFIHCREPQEITRIMDEIIGSKSILITADYRVTKSVDNNASDRNVKNFEYDIVISNDGTLEDLNYKAREFVKQLYFDSLVPNYE